MKFRKFLVAGALSCSLAFGAVSATPAFAVEFMDTTGLSSESAINKLVALGVMKNPGDMFDPEGELTRAEFTYMVNQVMALNTGNKKIVFKDLSQKNAAYTNALKMVNHGYLTLDKGSVKLSKGVTNAEMGKFLAQGLGLKKSWTNRPIDYLFYLVRKDVLDIDTDLDAVVTREQAAIAFDKYITAKGIYRTDSGIVVAVSKTGFTINNGSEYKTYRYAPNVSVLISGQSATTEDVQIGSPTTVILNKKGTVAYYGGELLDAEENTIKLSNAKWTIGTLVKEVNLEAYVHALPNKPKEEFTIKLLDTLGKAGAQFSGQVFFTNNDEVTALYPYISKVENKSVKLSATGTSVTVALSATLSETFTVSETVAITIDGKVATVQEFNALKPGEAVTATIEADANGNVTAIKYTTPAPATK
ncbi:S-layer homology domain-containing protein [Peribacillus acanthi]|uniref:S-layer homology domain-containing protein n=1 Tax=Peribacillus acanthi TaxID=2171554 RepID=UPI000D3E2DC2|nr:S-layer homology domain-containing protein [Peribacillus acanthi]